MTPGKQTTEFVVVIGSFVIAALSGLDVDQGSISYELHQDMIDYAKWIGTTYIGARSGVKVAEMFKKPKPIDEQSVANKVIAQILEKAK